MKNFLFSVLSLLFFFSFNNLDAQCFSEQIFNIAGQTTFIVPGTSGESYLIEIEAEGADGGDFLWSGNPQTDGGSGAKMKASFLVPGGSDLLVIVGTSGFDAPGSPGGGGGGGGTAVIINNSDVLIVAGAGGGGGQGDMGEGGQANTNSPPAGGSGPGSSGGGGFNADGGDGAAGSGGGAGTLSGQGLGGEGGITAGGGGAGFGGGGGGSGTVGGGGGGYKGGDGSDGSTGLNGKGGDSYINTLFSGIVIFNTPGISGGGSNNNGSVIITCIPQSDVEISLVSKTDPECFGGFDGSIEVSAMGGLEPYQYALNGGTYGDSPLFTGLSAGNYTVTVQDGSGATDVLAVTLTSPSQIIGEIVSVTNNVCFGASEGSIVVTATGGTSANSTYGYSVNGSTVQSSGVFNDLPSGFYVISIFDDNLCSVQLTTTITSPDAIDLIVISKTDITCNGMDDGSISVAAFGGTGDYVFSIDDGPFQSASQFFDLVGGTHIVTVMDEEGCTEEIIVFLDEPDVVVYDLVTTNLICFNDDDGIIKVINIIGTPPFQFKLNDGETTSDSVFTGLVAGEYEVTVIDSSECEWIQSTEIVSPDSLVLNVMVVMDVQCGGDSTGAVQLELLNGVGEIMYSVDQTFNFSGLFENLTANEYTASATDSMGCSTEVDFEIQGSATFTLSSDTVINVSCFGGSDGSVTINVTDGIVPIQYSINGIDFQDSALFSGLAAGDYEVVVVDSTGCANSIDITIAEPPDLSYNFVDASIIACFGGTGVVEFSVMGGTSPYFYEDVSGNITEFAEDELVFDSGISAGDYIVSVEDSNGCIVMDTVTLTQNDSIQLVITTLEGDNCGTENSGYVDLDAMGGVGAYTYSINGGTTSEGVFDSLAAGSYLVTVFDSLGCTTSMTIDIPQLDGLMLDSLFIGDVSCNGALDGYVEFFISNGSGVISIILDSIEYTDNLVDNLSGGIYSFVAQDENGCSLEIEVEIIEPDSLTIEVTDANLGEGYIAVEANGGTKPYRYSIDDKVTTQDSTTFSGLEPGVYTIIVIDDNGCENYVVFSLVGISESDFSGLHIYPNPVSRSLHIEFDGGYTDVKMELLNKLGQVVKTSNHGHLENYSGNLTFDVSGISRGIYVLRLRQNEMVGYYQIVIVD